jgi:hypothetical protein
MIIRKAFLLSILVCVLSLKVSSQSIDSIACSKVEDTLRLIENLLIDVNSDPHLKRIDAIAFLCSISKIPYEGCVTFIGTEFPAKSFFIKCKEWYFVNRKKLAWDETQNQVVIRE